MPEPIAHRYDFVYLFDITDGNPNGDPDAGNLPRVDPETGQGLVTDVCLKRKVRDYVQLAHTCGGTPDNDSGYQIFVKSGTALNAAIADAHEATGGMPPIKDGKWKTNKEKAGNAAAWLCLNFFDIRTFGAVLSTGANAGQVRGPVQLGIARSIDPIFSAEFSITRCATTDDKLKAKKDVVAQTYRDWEADQAEDTLRTMGRKFTVPYALYRVHGYINASLAQQTSFNEDDLSLFKKALDQMFEHDRSAARGNMAPRGCIAFRHDNKLGNARADQLFKRVKIERNKQAASNGEDPPPPRSFEDYTVNVNEADLPEGVSIERWVEA